MASDNYEVSFLLWPYSWAVLIIILLFSLNNTFNYYCKLILYYVIILFVSLVTIPVACFRPFDVTNTNVVARLLTAFCKPFGIKWKIQGEEHLKIEGPGVVICNHQSAVDVLGMMHLWPIIYRCVSMVKKELKYALSFGVLATLCGTVFIDRLNSEKAHQTINHTVNYLKAKNSKVWVFPEGTRNSNGTMLPFKKGAFHLAVQGELPIIPIVFSSYSNFYSQEKKIFHSGTVDIKVLPPISTKGLTKDDVTELSERVRSQMLEVFKDISNISSSVETNGKKK